MSHIGMMRVTCWDSKESILRNSLMITGRIRLKD